MYLWINVGGYVDIFSLLIDRKFPWILMFATTNWINPILDNYITGHAVVIYIFCLIYINVFIPETARVGQLIRELPASHSISPLIVSITVNNNNIDYTFNNSTYIQWDIDSNNTECSSDLLLDQTWFIMQFFSSFF